MNLRGLGLKKTELPKSLNPQLATLTDIPPKGKEWLHEVKLDGYRLLCRIDNKVQLITRGHHNWTHKFKMIAADLKKLKLKDTIIDGEVVAIDNENRVNFQLLQNSIKEGHDAALYYYVFDLIYYKGYNLSSLELVQRKKMLQNILANYKGDLIRYSDHVIGHGDTVFKEACKYGLEGIISKDIHSAYVQKRSKSWLKLKCTQRQQFVVGGYTKGSLLLGYYDKQKHFIYCGRVGTGFSQKSLQQIKALLQKHHSKKSPFLEKPAESGLISWVKPKLVVEVEFIEWTDEGHLRHPSFKGVV